MVGAGRGVGGIPPWPRSSSLGAVGGRGSWWLAGPPAGPRRAMGLPLCTLLLPLKTHGALAREVAACVCLPDSPRYSVILPRQIKLAKR